METIFSVLCHVHIIQEHQVSHASYTVVQLKHSNLQLHVVFMCHTLVLLSLLRYCWLADRKGIYPVRDLLQLLLKDFYGIWPISSGVTSGKKSNKN